MTLVWAQVESLADYYVARGQPPGRWAGRGAAGLGVTGVVTEEQMRTLFGEGRHPTPTRLAAGLVAEGRSEAEALRATRLGRRFPQYGPSQDLRAVARRPTGRRKQTWAGRCRTRSG